MFLTSCLRNCLLNHDIAHTPLILLLQLREGKRIPPRKLQGSFFKTYVSSKSLLHMNVVNTVFRIYQNTYLLLLEVSRQTPPLASLEISVGCSSIWAEENLCALGSALYQASAGLC